MMIYTYFILALIIFQVSTLSNKKILVIGIDGYCSQCLKRNSIQEYPQYMQKILQNSAYSFEAYASSYAVSSVGWTQVLCSVMPVQSKVFKNSQMPFYLHQRFKQGYPCLFEEVKKFDQNYFIGYYYSWQWLRHYGNKYTQQQYINDEYQCIADLDSQIANLTEVDGCDQKIIDKTVQFINQQRQQWMHFLVIGGLDIYGHMFGFCSNEYHQYNEQKLDNYLKQIFLALEQSGQLDDVTIIITSDHGATSGSTYHGQQSDDNIQVPLIIYNRKIFQEAIMMQIEPHILDVAPTIMDLVKQKRELYQDNGWWRGRSLLQYLGYYQSQQCLN